MPSQAALDAVERYAGYIAGDRAIIAAGLDRFRELLERWQRVQNLVSRETLPSFWDRHVVDSLQLLKFLHPTDHTLVDLGSGGGFPALPLAIALRASPTGFLLIEPTQRKVSFLRTAARELELKVEVRANRAEEIDSRETLTADVVTSRALAPLPVLTGLAARFFGPNSRALFHKGREYVEELAETRALWDFDVVILKSDTSADGAILEMSNLRSRSKS